MKSVKQVRQRIEEIEENIRGLKKQGRHNEAHHWIDAMFELKWVIGEEI